MTCNDCIHGELCISRTDTIIFNKTEYRDLDNVENFCEDFKNKADFVEVVRREKCKHGKVAVFSKTVDGEERRACYCNIKNKVTDIDGYCPSGERRDT